jgi:hypothetical protein
MIPWSTVVAKTHDGERCNVFGDVESFSEMDTPLVGDGTPSEAFADSRRGLRCFGVTKIKGSDSRVITEIGRQR